MEGNVSNANCSPLPLSALRLLVPPIRLVSAAMWQTVQQKVVADYGMLEEFVSMVTDIVPELLTPSEKVQLILGLRARLLLELCRSEAAADAELLQTHLDRVQTLIQTWVMNAGAATMEVAHLDFVELVKKLLKNPDERENFFQNVFPEEFGPSYDDALTSLMLMFLSRLEQFLPLQTFQQVASMFGEVSLAVDECLDPVSQHEEFRTLLQYHKDLRQLDYNYGSLEGTFIISALKLPTVERNETDKAQTKTLDNVLSCSSDLEKESLTLSSTTQMKIKETKSKIIVESDTQVLLEMIEKENRLEDAPGLLKQCHVQLERLDAPLRSPSRPVRKNRGTRMKKILLEEKKALGEETLTASKSRRTKPSDWSLLHVSDNEEDDSYMAPINNSSEEDSWSYYSDKSSHSLADSWSSYSADGSFFGTPVCSPTHGDSLSSGSNEAPDFLRSKNESAICRQKDVSNNKPSAPKKTPGKLKKFLCLICKQHVDRGLRSHMKTHFPNEDYACPQCDSRFHLFSSFKLHLSRTCFECGKQQVDMQKPEDAKGLYRCDQCDEAFRYKVSLARHKLTHNELYCSVCRRVLQDAASLARHKASHTLFQCIRCEDTFPHFRPLVKHCENVHKISRPFKCNYCTKVVSQLRFLIPHEWKHTGHLPFQCAQCGLRFRNDGDLTSHQRVHTREKPFLCAECGKTFAQKSNLLRHLNLIHGESRNKKNHSCSECEKSFKEKGALKKHQRTKHLKELFRHPCPYCGKMLSSSTISRHKLIHTGERPFKCTIPECDKHFRSNPEVKKHVLLHHTTERPYKCDVCGKGFIKMCYLNTHAKTHSGEKPFVCHICGKAFPRVHSMRRHKKLVHTFVTN
ncbi:zinc finger protein 37-like [Centropristis striata]|uniref:zinc finger protein 37-like n=1 Tax=Centropristis striata TaxID=184440 RepID=UPI0027E0B9C1|nr:zinc finger protein 37-like [Centropristis striata]